MPRQFGLRAALIILVLIAIAPVFVVVTRAAVDEQAGRLRRAEATLGSLVALAAAQQERLVDGARQLLNAMAYSPPLYGDDIAACTAYLDKLQQQHSAGGTLGLLDASGQLACRSPQVAQGIQLADRSYFRDAVQTGRFAIGEYTVSRATGRPVLPFGYPVYTEPGRLLRGVAYVAFDATQFGSQLRRMAMPPEYTLVVADGNGVVLASVGPAAYAVGKPLPPGHMRDLVDAGQPRVERVAVSPGEEWLFSMQPVGRPEGRRLFVGGQASVAAVLAASERRLQLQIGALLVIAILGAILAWVFAERILLHPLAQLLRQVDTFARGELRLDQAAGPSPVREFGALHRAFRRMAKELAEREVQRDGAIAEMTHQKNMVESVLESMAEGVLVFDAQGRFLHINRAAHRILPGLLEFSRRGDVAHVDPADWGLYSADGLTPLAAAQRPMRLALQGEPVRHFEMRVRGALAGDGEKVVQGSARPIVPEPGRIGGAVVVFSDSTEAWRAAQALKDSEQRYRTLFQSNPHPMWVFDATTLRFLTVNDAAVARYGYTREEFLSMTVGDIRPEEDRAAFHANVVRLVGPLSTPRTWRHRLKDGRTIRVEVTSHSLQYEGREAWLVLAHDITARVEAEEALVQLTETLERRVQERTRALALANRELESFSYSVSHDLRTPLQVIDGFGRALQQRHADRLDQQARHYLERIRDNTRQMGQLIDDLLALARVTRAEIAPEPFDLAVRARHVVDRLRQQQPLREVVVDIDEPMPCSGDPQLLAIVLENLIGNAWKFTSRTPDARIHVGLRIDAEGPVYFVTDNGAGFDMAYADKLFKAFQRLHATTEFEGTGIGLATVHRIVTRHGGRVWAESEPGVRTTFHFTLYEGAVHEEQPHPAGRGQQGPPGTDVDDAGGEQRAQRGGGGR